MSTKAKLRDFTAPLGTAEQGKRSPSLAIHARGLQKTYSGGVRALDGVSFSVETSTVFALLGPNGAGKTTAVKILTTLAKPDAGEARVAGYDVVREAGKVRRVIGVVAQKSSSDPEATGRENLVLQGQVYGLTGRELKRRVNELLEHFRLIEAADRFARSYSGGMLRKLDVAMGLIHRPKVLFLDEPTTGLDPESRADMWQEISSLSGTTTLLTTHYLEEADRLVHRLAIIDRGRVVVEGSPEALKAELKGDALSIELAEPGESASLQQALAKLEGVRELALDGRTLHARADSGATSLPALLTMLEAQGIRVASATVARPSLNDVYLRHAGRAFNDAQGGKA
jgi:ABC-2 type transport system ATP-binding protein